MGKAHQYFIKKRFIAKTIISDLSVSRRVCLCKMYPKKTTRTFERHGEAWRVLVMQKYQFYMEHPSFFAEKEHCLFVDEIDTPLRMY